MRLDNSDVWVKRVRLQMELRDESKMEAWLESIGKGTNPHRRQPSEACVEFMAAHAESGGQPRSMPDGLGSSCWWSTPTDIDIYSDASGFDEESRSVTDV